MAKTPASKDNLARIVSLMALLFTGATFYFNFFYVSRDVKALVLETKCDLERLSTSFAVVNNGNQQVVIIDAFAQLMIDADEGRLTIASIPSSTGMPVVVEPGSIVLIRIEGLVSLDKRLSIPTNLNAIRDTTVVFAHIVIRSTDGRGIQFASTSPLAKVQIMPGQISSTGDPIQFDVFDHETEVSYGVGQFD